MNNNGISLAGSFQEYFSVDLALTPEQKKKVYQVRYRVYCEELGYEPADLFPDQLEYDEYDRQSCHLLITHKQSGLSAGCVRLVKSVQSRHSFLPFEKNFPAALDPEFFSRFDMDRNTICEISRLAVDSRFRRRPGETFRCLGDSHAMDITCQEQRAFSLIAESVFLAAIALTELTGRTNIFALMEPYLCRLLGMSGIHSMRVGKEVQHHGKRAPHFITAESAVQNMRPELLGLYQSIYDKLASSYSEVEVAA